MMNILLIGASSAIGCAIIEEALGAGGKVVAVTRQPDKLACYSNEKHVTLINTRYSESAIAKTVQMLNEKFSFQQIFICNGVLHNDHISPEKRVEDISADSFNEVFNANTLTPLLWLKYLVPKLEQQCCQITLFSARGGSINDNQLGGWYSYRASKAALNMAVKSLAIECQRRAPKITLVLFHPGTTDSPLSKPFQRNVPKNKLFSPAFVAKQLKAILDDLPAEQNLHFIDWQGKSIPW